MNEITAYCGLQCHDCTIFLATREQDEEKRERMRREVLHICNEQYSMGLTLEDITECDSCTTAGGRLFSGCGNCRVRACCIEKGLVSCAFCGDCPCPDLEEILKTDPGALERLELIKIGKSWTESDKDHHRRPPHDTFTGLVASPAAASDCAKRLMWKKGAEP